MVKGKNHNTSPNVVKKQPANPHTDTKNQCSNSENHKPQCTNEKNRQRSMNIFCGCLVRRAEVSNKNDDPLPYAETQLLPSSAIQSMESLTLSLNAKHGTCHTALYHPLGATSDKPTAFLQPAVNLPSCALITDALLSQAKQNALKHENSNLVKSSTDGQFKWYHFRSLRRRILKCDTSTKPQCVADHESSHGSSTNRSEINESLVFSPLPSEIVAEIPRFDKQRTLLGPVSELDKSKKCFVIDLDETLVHSSFKVVENADFKVGVEIDGITHRVYVLKRPYVDLFLSTMTNLYECVLFTASLAKYADPVADFIDQWNSFRYRLFRDSCVYHRGNYVKDLSHLGRPINQVVILDNSPASYMFHAEHAVQISSWFDDTNDRTLLDLIPYFEELATQPNVVDFLKNNAPPTPFAAVGTVGLITNSITQFSFPANTLITNIQYPNVVSPLPSTDDRDLTKQDANLTDTQKMCSSTTQYNSQRLTPVVTSTITKAIQSTDGRTQNSATSFLSPLSLANYLPLTSQSSVLTVTNKQLYTSAQICRAPESSNPISSINQSTQHLLPNINRPTSLGGNKHGLEVNSTVELNQYQMSTPITSVSQSIKLYTPFGASTNPSTVIDKSCDSSIDTGGLVSTKSVVAVSTAPAPTTYTSTVSTTRPESLLKR